MTNDPPFRRIAIVGVGLIGGSIALAARRRWQSIDLIPIDVTDDLAGAYQAGLIVLAAPVLANIGILERLRDHIPSDTLVTDTGSTKRRIVAAAQRLSGMTFIGGHPMAGGARGGAASARVDLFDGRPWILTPGAHHPPGILAHLETFVTGLGGVPHVMTPELHDRVVGAVSHLPQLTASALMHVVGKLAGDAGLEIAGAGLSDTTRLAASSPGIWRDVAMTNEDVLREALDALIDALTDLRDSLDTGEAIDAIFTSACRWRSTLDRGR